MSNYLSIITDWPVSSLLTGTAVFFLVYLLQELLSLVMIRKEIFRSVEIPKAFRLFLRFELVAMFLFILERSEETIFPWDLIYRSIIYLIAGLGIMIPFLVLIDKGADREGNEEEEKKLVPALLGLLGKSLKLSVALITFAIILWGILDFIPDEYKNYRWFGTFLIINGILISVIMLIILQKSLKSSIGLAERMNKRKGLVIMIRSLKIPLLLLVPIINVLWFDSLYGSNSRVHDILIKCLYLLILVSFYFFIYRLVEIVGLKLSRISEDETNALDKTFIEMVRMIIRIALIFIAVFSAIRILTGRPLTSLLAGLGIGGLALALAAQDTLKNFFGSLMIMVDKPFKIGQRVIVKGYDGTIEEIGFRSTRIRNLNGHQVIIPNDQMASASIENIGKRPYIKRVTNITVTYSTSPEKMAKALAILREILDNHEGMSGDLPPRVYFNEYNADSLNILMIYWYTPPDYWQFMEFTERVNLEIMERFNSEGIEFAFPTNTTYLEQEDGKSIRLELAGQKED